MGQPIALANALMWLTLPLFNAACVIMVWIVCDVWPSMHELDRLRFRRWSSTMSLGPSGRELQVAWSEHRRLFPHSRKRLIFGSILIFAALSLLSYPLWFFFLRG